MLEMRSVTPVVLYGFIIATAGTYAQEVPPKIDATLPIVLRLKENAAKPFNLKESAPEIVYEKSPACTALDAAWLVEIDAIENGKPTTYAISAGDDDKNQSLIPLPDRQGTFAGKAGSWQQRVELFLSFSDASSPNGQGILRFTLVDSKEAALKAGPGKARKLAKGVEIPIQLKKSDGPVVEKPLKPKSSEADREKSADSKLKLAKTLLKTNRSAAIKRLEEIVKNFEGTAAAMEASKLLNDK